MTLPIVKRLRQFDEFGNGKPGDTRFSAVAVHAADTIEELVEALAEAREALALSADIPPIDPRHSEAIADLCDRVGYGAVMSSASAQWRAKLGDLAGSEFCAGPCRGTAEKAIETIDAALARTGVTLNG